MDAVSGLCTDETAFNTSIKEFTDTLNFLREVEGKAITFKDSLQPTASGHAASKVQEIKLPKLTDVFW